MIAALSFGQDLIITAAYDGPLSGGTPKGVELYVVNDIADLSIYGLGSANNGGGTDGEEFTFPADNVTAGTYIYVATEAAQFTSFFGFAPQYTSGAMGINGDDAVELFESGAVIDVFGDINTDGSGQPWDYLDGWAYRVDGTGPDGSTFTLSNWTFSGINALDGESTNAGAANPIPVGTYSTTASTTPTINVTGNPGNMFYFEGNGPSTEEEFTVSGLNLTSDINIDASTPAFEFSLNSGGTFSSSISITPSGGTVNATTVYVRLVSGLSVGSYSADATVSSTGASSQLVSLSGLVDPADPLIDITGGISNLSYNEGNGPSAEDSFAVGGLFLTEDITVTAPANFEVSLTSGSGFGSSVIVSQTGGTAADTDVFIRLVAGLAQGTYSGDVTATSTGATDQIIPVNGEVFPSATCANVGDIIITEVMQNPSVNGDPAGEYFEVYNTTGSAIDMIGWVIKDDLSTSETHTISSTLIVAAGDYVVIGNEAVPNGNTPMDYTYGNDISLGNGTDGVIIECSSTTIDVVIWDNGTTFPDPSGASMELSTTALDAVSNDNGANWGEATTAFGDGDLGTPGAANDFTLSNNQFDVNTFKIYPNPNNTGVLTILGNSNATLNINVYDVLGQRVLSQEIMSNNTLDVSKLKSGVYLVNIAQDNRTVTKKLVIK